MSGMDKLITQKRLTVILDAYGADPERWPAEERAAALSLIDSSAEARSLFEDARSLDSVLDHIEEPAVSPAFARRVRGFRPLTPGHRLGNMFTGIVEWLRPGSQAAWQGAVAAAAVVGIATGIGLSEIAFDRPAPVSGVTVASPVVTTAANEPALLLIDDATSENGPTLTPSLGPDITLISLTGDDGANSQAPIQADDSEMAVASIPLY